MTKTEAERIAIVETKVDNIYSEVTNHIPTSIRSLEKQIVKINLRLAYASGAVAIVVVLAQVVLNTWGK